MNITRETRPRLVSAVAAFAWLALAVGVAAQAPDFSQAQIKPTKVAGDLYALEGPGGTMGALVGPDGVFLVDAGFAQVADKVVGALKPISDGRIRYLVNTHVHADHTGG